MARKSSKIVSSKKRTSIPPTANPSATPPKKAAADVKPAPVVRVATPETQPKTAPVASQTATASAPVQAAEKISSTADRALVAARIAALRDINADVARDAATELGRLGDPSAVEPLIEALNNENDYFHSVVRAAAASSLA